MTDCERCAASRPDPVPFLTHEKDMARMERTNTRLWIVILVLIGLLLATNLGWVYYESQFQVSTTETQIEQDTSDGGYNYIVGGDYNGTSEDNDTNTDANP